MNDLTKNIANFAIVDDKPENRAAAMEAILELLPHVSVHEYTDVAEFTAAIQQSRFIDFVISELCMVGPLDGYEVAKAAWSWGIPCAVISDAIDGKDEETIVVGYPNREFEGSKADPAVWKQIIEHIFTFEPETNGLVRSLDPRFPKREVADIALGSTDATTVCFGFSGHRITKK